MNVPNALTLARIALIPFFVVCLYLDIPNASLIAGIIFVIAAATDFVDGRWARRKNQVTTLGKFLDPIADKLLVSAAFVMLVQSGQIPAYMVIVILSREFIVSGLRIVAASDGVVIPAGMLGKIKTFLQMAAIIILLFDPTGVLSAFGVSLGDVVLWAAFLMTIWSGIDYVARNWRIIVGSPQEKE